PGPWNPSRARPPPDFRGRCRSARAWRRRVSFFRGRRERRWQYFGCPWSKACLVSSRLDGARPEASQKKAGRRERPAGCLLLKGLAQSESAPKCSGAAVERLIAAGEETRLVDARSADPLSLADQFQSLVVVRGRRPGIAHQLGRASRSAKAVQPIPRDGQAGFEGLKSLPGPVLQQQHLTEQLPRRQHRARRHRVLV